MYFQKNERTNTNVGLHGGQANPLLKSSRNHHLQRQKANPQSSLKPFLYSINQRNNKKILIKKSSKCIKKCQKKFTFILWLICLNVCAYSKWENVGKSRDQSFISLATLIYSIHTTQCQADSKEKICEANFFFEIIGTKEIWKY